MRVSTAKCLLLILLLTIINLGIGSANLAETYASGVNFSTEISYIQTINPYFSGIRPNYKPSTHAESFITDFSAIQFDELVQGKGLLTKERMMSFLWLHNTKLSLKEADEIVSLYITESAYEGINHDIAFSQMCLETGFLKFGGDVTKNQFNYCGLGATGSGVSGLGFSNVQEGVRAHIQHLKAYASTEKLNNDLVDSRFDYVKRGTVKSYEQLTGKWAADPHYHHKLKSILQRLYSGSYAKADETRLNKVR
jgi:hypothetical protein